MLTEQLSGAQHGLGKPKGREPRLPCRLGAAMPTIGCESPHPNILRDLAHYSLEQGHPPAQILNGEGKYMHLCL